MDYHKQCILRKGNRFRTAWIPMKFAEVDRYLMLKNDNNWEDGWKVIGVATKMESKRVQDQSDRNHKGIFASIKQEKTY